MKGGREREQKAALTPVPSIFACLLFLSCFGYILVSGVDQIMSRNLADCL